VEQKRTPVGEYAAIFLLAATLGPMFYAVPLICQHLVPWKLLLVGRATLLSAYMSGMPAPAGRT